jgi:pyruvate kinase
MAAQYRTFPRTKFIATLGPASANSETLQQLLEAGVSVFRLNFSHGDNATRKQYLDLIRAHTSDQPVAIMGDLCGPKIRVGKMAGEGMVVATGDIITIRRGYFLGQDGIISSNFPRLIDDLEVGQRVLIEDGLIRMLVVDKLADEVRCQVTTGGTIKSNKGLNLPNTQLSTTSITAKDWEDVAFAIEHGLDYLALSFVRSANDINEVRRHLEMKQARIDLIAKIEMPQAVENLAQIIEASDAVLVARGDLGVEMELTGLPIVQKRIVAAAQDAGKPAIVATQMLQSMVDNPSPTRAEVSDVANAILDGADACMLSNETAVGKYPVQAVLTLRQIAEKTEDYIEENHLEPKPPKLLQMTHHRTAAIARGARAVVDDINAKLMVVWSQAGGSARYLSKNRFGVPIIALSSAPEAVRRMCLYYGVIPIQAQAPETFDALPVLVDRIVHSYHLAEVGDRVVIAAGAPLGIIGVTNSLSVQTVGRSLDSHS